MPIVADMETNGLLEDVTTFHCFAWLDVLEPDKVHLTRNLAKAISVLEKADTVYMHNGIAYDKPVIEKLCGREVHIKDFQDTLVMSRTLYPDREGGHSVKAWLERLGGDPKVENEDWTVYTDHMGHRCRSDVEGGFEILKELWKEMSDWNWTQALKIEHRVAEIIAEQERNGCSFDIDKAYGMRQGFETRISEIDAEASPLFPLTPKPKGATVNKPFKISGDYTKMVTDWYASWPEDVHYDPLVVEGPFTRVEFHTLNMGSDVQIKKYLLDHGWVPTEYNYNKETKQRTSPKLTEDSFDTIEGELGHLIKERKITSHRRSQLQGWIDRIDDRYRIGAGANPCGTNTRRMKHYNVVNVPAARALHGADMRSLFCAPEGWIFAGYDGSGLELRMLAHYMNDPEYTEILLNGDIHSHNQKMAGLPSRDAAKTFIYAFLYGAGDPLIGALILPDGTDAQKAAAGKKIKKKFLDAIPSLKKLIKTVKEASKRGYLKSLDGGKIHMRRQGGRVMEHKALNTLLQSAGSICMKLSMIYMDDALKLSNIEAVKVIDMHDESQAQIKDDSIRPSSKTFPFDPKDKKDKKRAESEAKAWSEGQEDTTAPIEGGSSFSFKRCEYARLARKSIRGAGLKFKLNVPLEAEVKLGKDWNMTH